MGCRAAASASSATWGWSSATAAAQAPASAPDDAPIAASMRAAIALPVNTDLGVEERGLAVRDVLVERPTRRMRGACSPPSDSVSQTAEPKPPEHALLHGHERFVLGGEVGEQGANRAAWRSGRPRR